MTDKIELSKATSYSDVYTEFDEMPIFEEGTDDGIKLLQGVIANGFEHPSTIQQKAIMALARKYNVIGQSQSGTGKTGAFVIGSLSRFDPLNQNVQIIYLAHTHELAQQIISVVQNIGSRLLKPNSTELCIGQGVSVDSNIEHIKQKRCQILVGTPGRMCDLVRRTIRTSEGMVPLIDPRHVKVVILDEADKLLSDKFGEEIEQIINTLDNPKSRQDDLQLGIFSATLSPDALEKARDICVPKRSQRENWQEDRRTPVEVLVPVNDLSLEGIEQFYYEFESQQRGDSFNDKVIFITTMNEIRVIPQCIIYVNNQDSARDLSKALCDHGLETRCIYGKMTPIERMQVTTEFRNGIIRVLVATDLLSRGFDVQQVSLVINADLPYVTDRNTGDVDEDRMAEYLHRIGRSGRFGRKGLAINLITNSTEKHRMEAIQKYYSTEIKQLNEADINSGQLY